MCVYICLYYSIEICMLRCGKLQVWSEKHCLQNTVLILRRNLTNIKLINKLQYFYLEENVEPCVFFVLTN